MGEPWFGVKRYGFGLAPTSPAGWLSLVVYVLALIAIPNLGEAVGAPHWAVVAAVIVLTVALLMLIALKSDHQPWRWRWGGR